MRAALIAVLALSACRSELLEPTTDGSVDLVPPSDLARSSASCPPKQPGGRCDDRSYCVYARAIRPDDDPVICECRGSAWGCHIERPPNPISAAAVCAPGFPLASSACDRDFEGCQYCTSGGTQGVSCSCAKGAQPHCQADFSCGG